MIKRFFPLLMAALLAASCGTTQSPQDKLTVNDKEIDKIIAQMTLEEKVNMLHSKTNMSSAGVERLGIADMNYADGPFGIREEGVRPDPPSRPPGPRKWPTCTAPAWARKPVSAART